jgi:hypothetical protein
MSHTATHTAADRERARQALRLRAAIEAAERDLQHARRAAAYWARLARDASARIADLEQKLIQQLGGAA